MYIEYKPWEWVTDTKDGNYTLVRADEETRKRQLEEYKKKRLAELKREMEEIQDLF